MHRGKGLKRENGNGDQPGKGDNSGGGKGIF
jgi:hypothetical protein